MKCPFCGAFENKVVDSRLTRDGQIVRRRRECEACARRFTTYERVEELLPLVVKKDGRREAFDRSKIVAGLKRACEKRPIGIEAIEGIVDRLELSLQERADREIPSSVIGEEIMRELHALDEVAYVRFASVYRQFKDLNQFMDELKDLLHAKEKPGSPARSSDRSGDGDSSQGTLTTDASK
jgi:transcriptional repressor NrdR